MQDNDPIPTVYVGTEPVPDDFPVWEYVAALDQRTRPQHGAVTRDEPPAKEPARIEYAHFPVEDVARMEAAWPKEETPSASSQRTHVFTDQECATIERLHKAGASFEDAIKAVVAAIESGEVLPADKPFTVEGTS